jgi:DNA-binding beta-propeller fold protein YncE
LNGLEEVDGSALPAAPASLAVSDDGAALLVAVPDNPQTSSTGGVFVFTRGDSGPRLIAAKIIADVSFFPASHDALLTDKDGNSVTLLADVARNATTRWVFTDDRLSAPTTAKASLDGQRILLGSAGNDWIALLDRDGGNAQFIPCACSPDRAQPLNNPVYQVTDPSKGLLWILDLSQDPRLFFVPIADASGESQ